MNETKCMNVDQTEINISWLWNMCKFCTISRDQEHHPVWCQGTLMQALFPSILQTHYTKYSGSPFPRNRTKPSDYCRQMCYKHVSNSNISIPLFHTPCRYLEFSKIRNFNGLSAVGGQYASSCQISSKSVNRLQTYGDITDFIMAAVRHLGFVKFEIFNVWSG